MNCPLVIDFGARSSVGMSLAPTLWSYSSAPISVIVRHRVNEFCLAQVLRKLLFDKSNSYKGGNETIHTHSRFNYNHGRFYC